MQLILKTLVTISYSFTQDQLLRTLQILQERRKQKATPTEQPASQNFRRTFYFFPLPKPAPGLPEPANQHSSPTTNTLPAFWKPLKATWLQELLLFRLRLEVREVHWFTSCLRACRARAMPSAADATGRSILTAYSKFAEFGKRQLSGSACCVPPPQGFFHPQSLALHPPAPSGIPFPALISASPASTQQLSVICLHDVPSIFNFFLSSKKLSHFLISNLILKGKIKDFFWFAQTKLDTNSLLSLTCTFLLHKSTLL